MTENSSAGKDKEIQIDLANQLNQRMRSGISLYSPECISLAKNFEHPIVIDFNNVLVNSGRPWVPNPEAIPAIQQLTQIGTVFVATTAWRDWELRQKALEGFGLWRDGMVLVTGETMITWEKLETDLIKEIEGRLNRPLSKGERSHVSFGRKLLSPVFGKSFDVPIIDDNPDITMNNPGMLGLLVRAFDPTLRTVRSTEGMKTLTMDEAVARVIAHYY